MKSLEVHFTANQIQHSGDLEFALDTLARAGARQPFAADSIDVRADRCRLGFFVDSIAHADRVFATYDALGGHR